MKAGKRKLTLDQPVAYEIKVPGHLDEHWAEWDGEMIVTVGNEPDGRPVTTLTGIIDQAALQGLLRRLYALGLPLISVTYVKSDQTGKPEVDP